MAENEKDFDVTWLDQQIEHPASSLDVKAQQLVEDLHRMGQPTQSDIRANAESLQRVQRRLQARFESEHQETTIVPLRVLQTHQERNAHMKEITPGPKKMGKVARFFGTLAAMLVITLLVGSLIWVFSASRGNTHVASPSTSSTPTAEIPDAPGIYILDILDANANKYAVLKRDIHTHAVIWSYPVPLDGTSGNPIFVNGDTVYATLGLRNDTYLYALNALNGSLRWKVAMNQYTVPGMSGQDAWEAGEIAQPAAAHGIVYALARGGSLVALDAATGKYLWRYTSSAAALDCTTVEVTGGLVYGTCHNVIFALNARTGALSWSRSAASNQIFNSPVAVDGTIYLTSSEEDHHYSGEPVSGGAYAYNGTHGQLLWHHPIDNWTSSPELVDGVVYLGSYDHMIYGLRASDGVQVWRYDTGGVVTSLGVSNGVGYAVQQGIQQGDSMSGTSSFMAIQMSNSQRLWIKQGVWGIDAVLGDVLYIHGADGFTVLNGRTDTVIWHGNGEISGIDVVP